MMEEFKVHNEQPPSKSLASTNVFKEKALAAKNDPSETPEEEEVVSV